MLVIEHPSLPSFRPMATAPSLMSDRSTVSYRLRPRNDALTGTCCCQYPSHGSTLGRGVCILNRADVASAPVESPAVGVDNAWPNALNDGLNQAKP